MKPNLIRRGANVFSQYCWEIKERYVLKYNINIKLKPFLSISYGIKVEVLNSDLDFTLYLFN